ncbi:histidine kinase [Bacillus sp. SL00103]
MTAFESTEKWLNTEPYLIVMLIVLTPIGGEFKFYPFEDSFRVSFGTVVFFFILLQMKKFPAWASGIIAGVSVFAFRVLLDTAVTGHLPLEEAVSLRFPPLLYYVVYGTLFLFIKGQTFPRSALADWSDWYHHGAVCERC